MIHDFHLRAGLRPGPTAPTITIESYHGVSLGRSPDGSVAVALLGAAGQEREAERRASQYLANNRRPEASGRDGIGAVVLDQGRADLVVVAAPIGLRQVYWTASADELAVGASPAALGAGPATRLRLQSLYEYVYFHMLPGPASVFEGIEKLDGGHLLRWDGNRTGVSRYWRPSFHDGPAPSETETSRQLHKLLSRAVERCLDDGAPAGAFLSGGLDSSTVAGLAARVRPGLPTVSMGFDVQGYDEMEYARIAARRFATRPLEYYVTPEDLLATLPEIAAAFAEPFGNSSAAAAYHCARIASEHGLTRLLAGDGGDEIFGGNVRYAKQMVFERYGRVPAAIRYGLLEPNISAAARITRAFPIGKAESYIQQARVPLPDRLQSYNFLHRHDPAEVFNDDVLAAVDCERPLRLLRDEYRAPKAQSPIDRMLFLDWKFTLHDNDLVKVNSMCAMAGIEVAYPMLDQDLVDFTLGLPADWKVRRGELRWFYKRAMRGYLPDEIIAKRKHGFGLPFGAWMRSHDGLRKLSEEALAELGNRGIFRREFLQDALRMHRDGHASYYGELVWILTVLELWLQAHHPAARL